MNFRISQDFNFTKISTHGTQWQTKPEYKLKLNYPLKPENLKKSLYIGYTESTFTMFPKKQHFMQDVIPEKPYYGLRMWFHDAFEMLYDDAIKLHTQNRCYQKILITPKISRIDDSIMDFNLEQ